MPIASQGCAPLRGALVRAALPATVLCASVAASIAAGVVLAGPAAAMEDPRRPAVEITAGPSCGPAVVRVQVTGGNAAGHVALVLDGTAVQQEADLAPGQVAELSSADIDWGVTVDVSVTAVGADGEALEPAQLGTYTRPSKQDCEAIEAPATDVVPPTDAVPSTDAVPPTPVTPVPVPQASPSDSPALPAPGTLPAPRTLPVPGASVPPQPVPPAGAGTPSAGTPSAGAAPAASSSSGTVAPGGVVRVRATGFAPGEQVTVTMAGRRAPLATVAAGPDGSVEAVLQIPHGADPGSADVRLVGADSAATAGVALRVAARTEAVVAGEASTRPVALLAGAALLVAAGGLGASALRRPKDDGQPVDLGS